MSTTQTSDIKPVGVSTTQNQGKNQNCRGRGSKAGTPSTANTGTSVQPLVKNDKPTGPVTRSKAKNALIQLLETLLENLL